MFELVSGADTVVVRSRDLDGGMYRVATPREAQGRPAVTDRDGVRWTVRIVGGAREQLIDLGAVPDRYDIQALAGVSGFTLDRR